LQVSSLERASVSREVFVVDAAGNDVGDCFLALRKVSDELLSVSQYTHIYTMFVGFAGEEEGQKKNKGASARIKEDGCLRDGDGRVHWHPCRFQRYC
jgi:hypothetical protein